MAALGQPTGQLDIEADREHAQLCAPWQRRHAAAVLCIDRADDAYLRHLHRQAAELDLRLGLEDRRR